MKNLRFLLTLALIFCIKTASFSQVFINEGSNKNYSSISDENGDFPDWIEVYNAGSTAIQLLDYALSDDPTDPTKWTFPNIELQPGEFKVIFCSGKDRKPITGFVGVLNELNYNPVVGWNNHNLTTPFYWDGSSSLLLNTCSYSSTGYTSNSVFNQSATSYYSTIFAFIDGAPSICATEYGTRALQRPNIKLNDVIIGSGTQQNSATDYPAPYGNWYWAAKNQMLIPAAELIS